MRISYRKHLHSLDPYRRSGYSRIKDMHLLGRQEEEEEKEQEENTINMLFTIQCSIVVFRNIHNRILL